MNRKHGLILSSVFLVAMSLLIIVGTQLLSGGQNPNRTLMPILLMILGGGIQTLAYPVLKNRILQIVPMLLSVGVALWGTYCYFFSPSWKNAEFWDLLTDYYALMLGCIVAVIFVKQIWNK